MLFVFRFTPRVVCHSPGCWNPTPANAPCWCETQHFLSGWSSRCCLSFIPSVVSIYTYNWQHVCSDINPSLIYINPQERSKTMILISVPSCFSLAYWFNCSCWNLQMPNAMGVSENISYPKNKLFIIIITFSIRIAIRSYIPHFQTTPYKPTSSRNPKGACAWWRGFASSSESGEGSINQWFQPLSSSWFGLSM